ncbi:MAG: hypothetical protein WD317_02740 [Balneolaceae bacterium]
MDKPWPKFTVWSLIHGIEVMRCRPDYKFWTSGADRKLEEHNMVRAEHYHHPLLNLLAVERMIECGGRITGWFA